MERRLPNVDLQGGGESGVSCVAWQRDSCFEEMPGAVKLSVESKKKLWSLYHFCGIRQEFVLPDVSLFSNCSLLILSPFSRSMGFMRLEVSKYSLWVLVVLQFGSSLLLLASARGIADE